MTLNQCVTTKKFSIGGMGIVMFIVLCNSGLMHSKLCSSVLLNASEGSVANSETHVFRATCG